MESLMLTILTSFNDSYSSMNWTEELRFDTNTSTAGDNEYETGKVRY